MKHRTCACAVASPQRRREKSRRFGFGMFEAVPFKDSVRCPERKTSSGSQENKPPRFARLGMIFPSPKKLSNAEKRFRRTLCASREICFRLRKGADSAYREHLIIWRRRQISPTLIRGSKSGRRTRRTAAVQNLSELVVAPDRPKG